MVFVIRFTVVFLLAIVCHASPIDGIITLDLVHRDHVASPHLSRADRLRQMVRRDMQRFSSRQRNNINGIRRQTMEKEDHAVMTTIQAGREYGIGEYIVKLYVGTPPQTVYMIPDTGSVLNMLKCRHNGKGLIASAPFFDADRSKSFQGIRCEKNNLCNNLTFMVDGHPKKPTCVGTTCGYSSYGYVSNFSTSGIFAHESFTFPQPSKAKAVVVKNMVIGCSTSGENLETINGTHGVLGLGNSDLAFPAQASPMLGQEMFAMCMVDHLSNHSFSGIFVFGPVPKGVLPCTMNYTTLDTTSFGDLRLYGLNVKGVYVNGKRKNIPSYVWNNMDPNGGTVVDTGTSVTYLNSQAYRIITDALNRAISRFMDSVVVDNGDFQYCYSMNKKKKKKYNESWVPKLEIEFAGGVRLEPARNSYLIDIGPSVKCLGFMPSFAGYSTIGNILLQDHFLVFDVPDKKFGFGKTVCKNTTY